MKLRVDLTGKRFGKLVVIEPIGRTPSQKVLWKCKCDCGKTTTNPTGELTTGHVKSCGCAHRALRSDLVGKRFGTLVAVKDVGRDKRGARLWECDCDCGKTIRTRGASLISGNTTSCGCTSRPDLTGKRFGRLTVIELLKIEGHKQLWKCQCDCGNFITRPTWVLAAGHTTSCGCFDKERRIGKSNPRWLGGKSFEPYCPKFNEPLKEEVREAFNRKCFLCGVPENGRKLSVHHINFDKRSGCYGKKWNLVPLCICCHTKTTNNRHYYFNLLNNYWALNPEINLL